jgi:hypothetical protein
VRVILGAPNQKRATVTMSWKALAHLPTPALHVNSAGKDSPVVETEVGLAAGEKLFEPRGQMLEVERRRDTQGAARESFRRVA